jgi:hypothetical protein
MNEQVDGVILTPEGEAERLWRRAEEAFIRAPGSIAQLCEAIDLGVRVIEIGVVSRLQPIRNQFPATIAALLESPPPDVDPMRDFVHPPHSLSYLDVVDMLSEDTLACISHSLHRGWEDRRESCRRSRERTRNVIGFSLSEDERKPLMLIGAYRNRLFALPPPVRIVPSEVIGAFPSLAVLADRLIGAHKVTSA